MLLVLALFFVGTALVATGCGGGEDSTTSLTKAQFVKQANALCAKYNKQMAADFSKYAKEHSSGNSSQALAAEAVGKATIPATKEELEALRELPVPSGEEEKVEALLERRQEALEKIEDEPLFKISGDPFEEFNQPLTDYGLTECAL
jgi:hypothetical protein